MTEKGIWLTQSEAALSMGIGISKFISRIQNTPEVTGRTPKENLFYSIKHDATGISETI